VARYLDNKLVFLAGSTGAVGSSIMKYMLDNCPETRIRAGYHQAATHSIKHARVEYVRGDLRSQKDCRRMVEGCDCAIMAAANTGGSNVMRSNPWKLLKDNLIMNTEILESFHVSKIERAVYIGSATLYQEFEGHIKEVDLNLNSDPHSAHFGMGWVVRFTEKLCKFWHDRYGMEIVIARAANVFGPYSKFNPATSNFIPAIIRKAVDRMDPFEVWGSPNVTRDVIYSDDFAKAIVMMLDNNKIKFDIFNIGSGIKTTVSDVVKWALEFAGHHPSRIEYNQRKPTTISFRALDCSKAEEVLGWRPQVSVEEGIKKTTAWWIDNRSWWKK